ncbi:MAG: DNA repair protein RecN [Prevotella sp.]|nr:DNA repair protein RecN [Prevotella sp.]
MLKQLYIKNFTLIDELDIGFQPGFSVMTGETGAGKSIILGAIGLLLGNRADAKLVKAGEARCIIEAHFDVSRYELEPFFEQNDIDFDENDCIVRREVNASGKSRAFINDTPVSATLMRELGDRLVDIHSQHQNLLLSKEDFQRSVVDIIAGNATLLGSYQQLFNDYRKAVKAYEDFKAETERNAQSADFMRFQLDELLDAKLQADEQEQLEQQRDTMSHAEDIKSALFEAENLLLGDENGIVSNTQRIARQVGDVASFYPAANELSERLESCRIELKDIADEMNKALDSIDFDPQQLDSIHQRLDLLYSLQQKHQVSSVADLIALRDELQQKIGHIENSDEELAELRKLADDLRHKCVEMAKKLTATREKSARKVEKEVETRLVALGIPNVRFNVELAEKPLSIDGADKILFLFSANKSTPMQPVSEVASGGEVARVMLSLKAMISGAVKLPTIIFDEIDTGVSGRVAEQMAHIMREMGDHERQVISITHLPQIAAAGSSHYRVSKTETAKGTQTSMVLLTAEERIAEIAQMLSGSEVTSAAIANAKQLLKTKK